MAADPMMPRLSDGIELDDLKDEESRSLSARIFYDEEIFRLEQERIFAGTWIPLAHESEIEKLAADRVIGSWPEGMPGEEKA